jgi:type II secretory pathway component GspD/PulD (secretin)
VGTSENGDATNPGGSDASSVIIEPTLSGSVKLPVLNSDIQFDLSNWNLTGITWNNIFSAASGRSDVRVFSSPSLMVSHNSANSSIKVGREITFVTTSYNNTNVRGNENTVNVPQTTPQTVRADTELQIKKPKIGLPIYDKNNPTKLLKPGTIFMEIEVEANKFDFSAGASNNYDGQKIPGRVTRSAQSVITAKSGDIIVLGGLQETIMSEVSQKYNLLSNLPYFGKKLFSPKETTTNPSELLIFIKPTIYDPEGVSDENFELINSKMSPSYEPVFTAPTGKILIDPKLMKISSGNNHKDTHSTKPLLN